MGSTDTATYPLKSKGRTDWTPEKRAALLETVIVAGSKAIDVEKVAADLGVSKSSVVDQLKPNRSNIRQTAIKAVKGANN
ncbi:hypothetical protein A1Q2_05345 [Trichosporon asahii var. asahii CBS 8904]|uniref:Uncharacterized protein n=1 Tax=Trichosporon asahii var. asahii (strain CBS 8904) TaxID=1220162 RepID=K1VHP4_TRIAC|nr:hypothetical protein A1Q2_05345 [Trichosporon asahii var. asahii CBS 8904]